MIAYFLHNFDGYSGAAKQAKLLAENIDRDVVFFNFGKEKVDKHNVINVPSSIFGQLFVILYFSWKCKIETFHLHGSFNAALIVGVILRKRILMKTTLLGDDDFYSFSRKKNWLIKKTLIKKVYKNIVLSKKLLSTNLNYLSHKQVLLIPNGVEIGKCTSLEAKEINSFCFVGLICERKRTYESIQYFLANYVGLPSAKMYIVGPYENIDSNEFSSEYVQKCFNLISDSGKKEQIIFTGNLPQKEVQTIIKKCKALLFFSKKEGMPNVVLESLAQNCVPITNELDGVCAEIFDNNINGFIISNQNETIDILAINLMIESSAPYELMLSRFDIKLIAKIYDELYEHYNSVNG